MAFLSSPLLPAPYDLDSKLGAIPILRQQKDWVGVENGHFLSTFSTIYADKVGGWGPKRPKIC